MKLLFLQTFAPLVFFLVITNQSCLHNQYYDTISSQCIDCQSGCDQCSNSSNNCTACIPNFYLANGSCLPCPKACYSCSNPSNCTNCKSNFYLSNGFKFLLELQLKLHDMYCRQLQNMLGRLQHIYKLLNLRTTILFQFVYKLVLNMRARVPGLHQQE